MRLTLNILLFFFLSSSLFAQEFTLKGIVVDDQNQPLIGTNVALLKAGQVLHGASTGVDGNFKVEGLKSGRYLLEISFLSYETIRKPIKIADQDLDLGQVKMESSNVNLGEVEVVEKTVMATQEGDTTSYNAKAFKTMPDANAQDLIEKMPGVVIENGKVQAQGEDVKEVLVDGRPFFGNDPTAALKNLPAEVVDKIQVFDQRSDQANFTGFDDGQTNKTINIVTKSNMRAGQFGKITGGYGTENRYKLGGNFSIFDGDRRISFIGMSNNINEQNFATEDLLGVVSSGGGRIRGSARGGRGGSRGSRGGGRSRRGGGSSVSDFLIPQQGGVAATNAIGINYSDKWGEKMDISGSYFFNQSNNVTEEILDRTFVDVGDELETYFEISDSETDNFNHRLNFRIEYKIDSANSIIMRPRVSWQRNEGSSNTFGQSNLGANLLSETNNIFTSNLKGTNFSNNLLFRHRFAKARRTFSVNVSSGYNTKNGDNFLDSENQYFNGRLTTEEIDQISDLDNVGWNIGTSFNYTEPIGKNSMLMMTYRYNRQEEEADKATFDYSEDAGNYTDQNDLLTNIFSNSYITNQLGAGYNWRKGRTMIMARANFQIAELDSDQQYPITDQVNQKFYNVLPFIMFRNRVSRSENLSIFYRTNTSSPSATQLQNVLDNTNPLQLSVGNPDLSQSYQHSLFARYQKTNTEKSTVFYAYVSGSITQDHISNATYLADSDHPIFADYQVQRGAQLTTPVNLDGYWNLRSFITYGLPLKGIKSNLNIDLSANYNRAPGLINDETNFSNNTTLGVGLTLSSNISEHVDFTISSRSSHNNVVNTLQTESNTTYFSQNSRVRLGWIFGQTGIIFRTTIAHQFYDGLSEEFDDSYFLWSASLGKKLFKNRLGEIALSAFDILKQNQNLTRNVTEIYIEDLQTQALQQYFMLNFTYNFRNFGLSKRPSEAEEEKRREERRRRW